MVRKMLKAVSVIVLTIIILIAMIGFASVVNTLSGKQEAIHYSTSTGGGQQL